MLNPNHAISNPIMMGIRVIEPDNTKLMTMIHFLRLLSLKYRFLYESTLGKYKNIEAVIKGNKNLK
jgi:hypothetical protein